LILGGGRCDLPLIVHQFYMIQYIIDEGGSDVHFLATDRAKPLFLTKTSKISATNPYGGSITPQRSSGADNNSAGPIPEKHSI